MTLTTSTLFVILYMQSGFFLSRTCFLIFRKRLLQASRRLPVRLGNTNLVRTKAGAQVGSGELQALPRYHYLGENKINRFNVGQVSMSESPTMNKSTSSPSVGSNIVLGITCFRFLLLIPWLKLQNKVWLFVLADLSRSYSPEKYPDVKSRPMLPM